MAKKITKKMTEADLNSSDTSKDTIAALGVSKYEEKYCEMIQEFMKDGSSALQFAVSIGVTRSTVYLWKDTYPEFSEAFHKALDSSEAWWQDFMKSRLDSKDANTALIMINMRNRFGWTAKDPLPPPITVSLAADSTEELSKIVEIAARARKEVNEIN